MKRLTFTISIVLILLFSGCGNNVKSNELEDTVVKLKWKHQAQFAGNYVAKDKGFYADEGLNVELVQYSDEEPTIDAVVDGDADLGITSAEELVLARSKGVPLVAFAVIYQTTPDCFYALKESGIKKPQDFVGKRVGLRRGPEANILYNVMMSELDIDRTQIEEVEVGYDNTELVNGEVDATVCYIINEPLLLEELGYEVNTILMADYGASMYGDVLFATEDTINNNPELVESFLKATIEGWNYAIDNKDEATDITLNYAINSTKEHQRNMLENAIPLIHMDGKITGCMEKSGWDEVQRILIEQGVLKNEININNAYTLEFVEKFHSHTE
ncbi:ABC transporter substrate-binding protein [Patescibacteria group bacterium]